MVFRNNPKNYVHVAPFATTECRTHRADRLLAYYRGGSAPALSRPPALGPLRGPGPAGQNPESPPLAPTPEAGRAKKTARKHWLEYLRAGDVCRNAASGLPGVARPDPYGMRLPDAALRYDTSAA